MDVVGVGGLALSAVGVALSLMAMAKAEGARKAVARVIDMSGDQSSRDRARDLHGLLSHARDAAMAQKRGAGRALSGGRTVPADLKALQLAQDALATATPSSDQEVLKTLRRAATDVDHALATIRANGPGDGWAEALIVLQRVLPGVDVLQRGLGAKALR